MSEHEHNPFPEEGNTGHIWDDNLRELANPAPNWWMMAFYASIAFVIGYGLIYPMIPLSDSYTKGLTGWTAIGEYKASIVEVEAVRKPFEDKIAKMSAREILADAELSAYVEASGKVIFGDNCAACHGTGGAGNPDFPVLADDDWLYGGSIEQIQATITNGRQGMMPKMGGQQLTDAEIDKLANAIYNNGTVTKEPLYTSKGCMGCHGPDGKGMVALGSANLTDSIWRFSEPDQLASIKYTIKHGVNDASDPETRKPKMPAFKDKLSEQDIKKMAVYVYKFGGGK